MHIYTITNFNIKKEDLPLVAEIASAQIFSAFSKQLRDAVDMDTELMTTLLTLIDKIYVRWMKILGETKNIELLKLGEKYSTEIVEIDNFIEIIVNDLFEVIRLILYKVQTFK